MWGTRSVWTLGSEFWGSFFHSVNTGRLPHTDLLLEMLGDDRQNPSLLKLEKERLSMAVLAEPEEEVLTLGWRWTGWRCGRDVGGQANLIQSQGGAGQEPGAPIPRGGGGPGQGSARQTQRLLGSGRRLLLSISGKGAMSWAACTAALSRDGREAGPGRRRGAETVRTHLGVRVPAGRASHIWPQVVCGSCVREELAVAGVH